MSKVSIDVATQWYDTTFNGHSDTAREMSYRKAKYHVQSAFKVWHNVFMSAHFTESKEVWSDDGNMVRWIYTLTDNI